MNNFNVNFCPILNNCIEAFFLGTKNPNPIYPVTDAIRYFKYQNSDVIFYFTISNLFKEITIIKGRQKIFHAFFYPLFNELCIISSDNTYFSSENMKKLNIWFKSKKF